MNLMYSSSGLSSGISRAHMMMLVSKAWFPPMKKWLNQHMGIVFILNNWLPVMCFNMRQGYKDLKGWRWYFCVSCNEFARRQNTQAFHPVDYTTDLDCRVCNRYNDLKIGSHPRRPRQQQQRSKDHNKWIIMDYKIRVPYICQNVRLFLHWLFKTSTSISNVVQNTMVDESLLKNILSFLPPEYFYNLY